MQKGFQSVSCAIGGLVIALLFVSGLILLAMVQSTHAADIATPGVRELSKPSEWCDIHKATWEQWANCNTYRIGPPSRDATTRTVTVKSPPKTPTPPKDDCGDKDNHKRHGGGNSYGGDNRRSHNNSGERTGDRQHDHRGNPNNGNVNRH